jgi:5-dehydro-4-deoxyglucarate dehydratase
MISPRQWHGVFGFPVTPFKYDLSLDLDALAANVDEMSKYPFCALVAAGGAGELYSLSPVEYEQVVHTAVEHSRGRPVAAGTGYNIMIGADLARRAERAGAECLLVLPPYYTNAPEEGLIEYYRAIGAASPLPLIVYTRDWAAFTPQQVARLADRVPAVAALKDGQGDVRRLQRIMQFNGDRLGWFGGAGDDCVPAYYAVGVQGFTSSISNIAPRLSLELAEAGAARDFDRLEELMHHYVHPFFSIRERARGYEVAAIKQAMEILGKRAGPVRPPLRNCRPEDVEELRKLMLAFRDWIGLSVAKK